jgi:DNA-3-methyladenine glycosylase
VPPRHQADVVRRARALLNRTITGHGVTVRITEVEAYGGREDPASHAFTRTPRSEIMYGPAYRLYVYRSYGIHFCANVVTGPREIGAAVLLRAGEVVDGHELARFRRGETPPERDLNLARGPGNLAQALGITLDDLGTDLLATHDDSEFTGVRLGPETRSRKQTSSGPRVGVSKAAEVPWRFWLAGDPTVSAYKRSPRAPKPPEN